MIILERGARETFEATVSIGGWDGYLQNNTLVWAFTEIHFFEEGSDDPYRSYVYPIAQCEPDCSYDRNIRHRSSNGTWERLFVESQDRPFYLERDRDDPDLARIVITFVPSVD